MAICGLASMSAVDSRIMQRVHDSGRQSLHEPRLQALTSLSYQYLLLPVTGK
jgi:hypothetical protein